MPAGHRRRAARAADPAGPDPGQQPQAVRGLLPRARHRPTRGGAAADRQARQDRAGPASAELLVDEPRATDAAGRRPCLALAEISGRGRVVRRRGARARRRPTRCSTRASSELVRVVETAARARARPGSWPTSRSPAGSTTTPAPSTRPSWSGYEASARSAPAAATTTWPSDGRTSATRASGISIGVTRLLGLLFGQRALTVSRSVPTCVLVAVPTRRTAADCDRIAAALRARGIATEVSPTAAKFGKQIRYAERRGIPYVWFPATAGDGEVKDIRSGERARRHPDRWKPEPADLLTNRLSGPA